MNPTDTTPATAQAVALDPVVLRLYETRKAAAEAKRARIELAQKIGNCENISDDPSDGGHCVPCFQTRKPKEQWCDICKAKLPVWEDYRKKVTASGAALRDVLRAGKRLAQNDKLSDSRRE